MINRLVPHLSNLDVQAAIFLHDEIAENTDIILAHVGQHPVIFCQNGVDSGCIRRVLVKRILHGKWITHLQQPTITA
jgi:hypothetical protein